MQTHILDDEIEISLQEWGRTFQLDPLQREPQQANIIHRLMCGVPGGSGFGITTIAMAVEDAVRQLHKVTPVQAAVLRAYYCGWGRRGVERFETAKGLARQSFSRRSYYLHLQLGKDFVTRELVP